MKRTKQQKTKPEKPDYIAIDLRMTVEELERVTKAAEDEAKAKKIRYSRNNFCVRAVLAAAESVAEVSQ
jgi:uncharacterized protein (DUF1778 family)